MACKTISNLITTATTDSTAGGGEVGAGGGGVDAADNSMRRLDRVSKNVLKNALQFTGRLKVVEAPPRDECDVEYDDDCPPPVGRSYSPGVVIAYPLDQYGGGGDSGGDNDVYGGIEGYVRRGGGGRDGGRRRLAACFDPLDGSGNADASICTGTVVSVSLIPSPLVGRRICIRAHPFFF
jgi:fructose-1,6-bisphosphatase I